MNDRYRRIPPPSAPQVGEKPNLPHGVKADPHLQYDIKSHGYPKGQISMFLHGRWLHDCLFISHRGQTATAAGGGVTNYAPAAIHTTQIGRAACIIFAGGSDWFYQDNVIASWQIYADNKHIASAMFGFGVTYVYAYVPPRCVINYYSQITNNAALIGYTRHSVYIVDFDAESDKYTYGEGSLAANPAIGALAWP